MADVSVRPATVTDVRDIARVQAAAWERTYSGVLPEAVIAGAATAEAEAAWEAAVRASAAEGHRVLVAVEGGQVVGFAAVAPASDPDLDPAEVREVHALCVAPDRAGRGHGSRLLNAVGDTAQESGAASLVSWVDTHQEALARLLQGAGFAPDGARRRLDLHGDGAVVVVQHRLTAAVSPPPQ